MKKQNPHKRRTLTSVQMKPEIAKMMARFVARGLSKSEIINEALRQYLLEMELAETRRQLLPLAQAKGIYTDHDLTRLLA